MHPKCTLKDSIDLEKRRKEIENQKIDFKLKNLTTEKKCMNKNQATKTEKCAFSNHTNCDGKYGLDSNEILLILIQQFFLGYN
jgi:hypothetical protein